MAKVTFVYPDLSQARGSPKRTYSPEIASLSASLKEAGHNVSLIHLLQPIGREEYIELLSKQEADIVAFSALSNVFSYVRKAARWTKEEFDSITICSGVLPTLCPEEVINKEGIDIVCVGEGEQALVELCNRLGSNSVKSIKNLWVKEEGQIFRNPQRPPVDLDDLPFPDKDLFDYKSLYLPSRNEGLFSASRGCPYDCAYCCSHALRKAASRGGGEYVRFKTVPYLISELKLELEKYDFIKTIHFFDDILPLRPQWFEEFTAQYRRQIGSPFICNLRPDLVNERTISLLKWAGCYEIRMGVESGNERLRREVLNRDISQQQILKAFALCKEVGMRIFSYNIVGLPFESMADMLDTVKLNAEIEVDGCQATIFYPIPKTKLYKVCEEQNLLTDRILYSYVEDTPLAFKTSKRNQILFVRHSFYLLIVVYRMLRRLPGPLSKWLESILDCILSARVVSMLVYPVLVGAYRVVRFHRTTYRLAESVREMIWNLLKGKRGSPDLAAGTERLGRIITSEQHVEGD